MLNYPTRPPTPREAALARTILDANKAIVVVLALYLYGRGWWVIWYRGRWIIWHFEKGIPPDSLMGLINVINAILTVDVSLVPVFVLIAWTCKFVARACRWLVWAATTKPREPDEWEEFR